MSSSKAQLTRRAPLDSLELLVSKGRIQPSKHSDKASDTTVLTHQLHSGDPSLIKSNVPPSAKSSLPAGTSSSSSNFITCRPLPEEFSNKCPCPDERKLLLDSAAAIAQYLLKTLREPKTAGIGTQGGGVIHWEAEAKRMAVEPLPEPLEPPEPETITDCKTEQLRAGKFITSCDCTKRNGLQHQCRMWGCSEKCVRLRPKQRAAVAFGDPIVTLDSTPRCCAGKLQTERYRMMESKIDELIRKSREPEHCKQPGASKSSTPCCSSQLNQALKSTSLREASSSLLATALATANVSALHPPDMPS